jgi:hypothetical protein
MPPATQTETPRKKKRRIKKLWIVLGSPVVLLLLLSLLAAWYQANLQRQIDAELAKIRRRGEPVTAEDLTAMHRVPEGVADLTQEWLNALDQFDSATNNIRDTPVEQIIVDELPHPRKNLSDEPSVTQLLNQLEPGFREIESLAATRGQVRYPRNFQEGNYALISHIDNVYSLARALALRAHWQVEQGESRGALVSLRAILRAGDTLEYEPDMISQHVRIKLYGIMMENALALIPQARWSAAQLEHIQAEVRDAYVSDADIQRAITGYFVGTHMLIHDPEAFDKEVPFTYIWTRRGDELFFLKLRGIANEVPQVSNEEVLARADLISSEIGTTSKLERVNHRMTILNFPYIAGSVLQARMSQARSRAVAALIACQRYNLAHDKWPEKLTELTPRFLDDVPLDPMD